MKEDLTIMENLHASEGPVSTLPGSHHELPMGTLCDSHPQRPAIKRVQGETDSFGCEFHCMCSECYDKYRADIAEQAAQEHRCDWCKSMTKNVKAFRDFDEGMSGPVYQVCSACRTRANEEAARELEENVYYDDYDD